MEFETIIGLEIHAELSTNAKIYCGCTTEFGGEPNTHCCPICTGMPGTLPVLNEKVVEYAVKAGLAMNCSIAGYSKQDRKNYFYPDLPKAYQISQFDLPLCVDGHVDIDVNGQTKRIGITRIHIEEDAGKLLHDQWETGTLADFNRCGVPLIEIVTEPDLRSPEEAKVFLETVKSILQYIDVSDCKMQEGSLRCDVNLSVRTKDGSKWTNRTEMKNLNSFSAAYKAMEYEEKRHRKLIEEGNMPACKESRKWDDAKGASFFMRKKEEAHEYRYFPEPDVPPIVLEREYIEKIKKSLPELPEARKKRYIEQYGLPAYDAWLLTTSKVLSEFFEEAVNRSNNAKAVSNWIMGDMMRIMKEKGMEVEDIPFPADHLAKLVGLIDNGTISGTIGKKVFEEMFDTGKDPEDIVKEKALVQVSDESELINLVRKVIEENPQSVQDFRSGKDKAFGFLVGQAMRASQGKANPQVINKLLRDELNK